MEDTVTLARQEREKQGPWEVEVSYGGEADLHRHLAGCDKNPGHQKFIPVDQFNVDHLPPGCQDNNLVDMVRAMSDLTVRVSVKYVSERRPEIEPSSGRPYPCYKDRGRNMMRAGTGFVWGVDKYIDEYSNYTTCSCQECLISPTPATQFARIYINTAAHVVYDDLEAAHTKCDLFFDKGGTPRACSRVVTLSAGSIVDVDVDADRCQMTCAIHDLDLADRLKKMIDHWDNVGENFKEKLRRLETEKQKSSSLAEGLPGVWDNLDDKFKEKLRRPETEKQKSSSLAKGLSVVWVNLDQKFKDKLNRLETEKQMSSSLAEDLHDAWDNLTIIVSHPHGCSKQVSVGRCLDWHPRTYSTATCPGSRGAWVYLVKERKGFPWRNGRVHCGSCEGDKALNFCSDRLSP